MDVCCANEVAYACGRKGTLLRGRHDEWETIKLKTITDDIWSLCWYRNTLYFATNDAVYMLKENSANRVSFGTDSPKSCRRLTTADGVMWSVGAKDVMAFDGRHWKRID